MKFAIIGSAFFLLLMLTGWFMLRRPASKGKPRTVHVVSVSRPGPLIDSDLLACGETWSRMY